MKLSLLRKLLLLDALVLTVVGVLFVSAPRQIANYFHFTNLPVTVWYLIGLRGCVLVSLAAAYVIAARNPIRHRLWIQIGILRAVLECGLGVVYLIRGAVTFRQAGFGTIIAALLAIAYIALYPRPPRLIPAPKPPEAAPAQ